MKAHFASEQVHHGGFGSPTPARLAPAVASETYEPAVYGASKRMNPVAAAASALVALGAVGMLLHIGNGHHRHHHGEHRLTVIELANLQPPPPPPPQAAPKVQPPQESPSEVVTPPPIIVTPTAPAPVIASPAPVPVSVGHSALEVKGPSAPAPIAQDVANAGDLSAKMISATPPTYPLDARRAKEQGVVVLSVLLSADGRVSDISVSSGSGHESLDRAALRAVRHWRWSPTVRNGSAMLVRGLVTIPFVLRSQD
ncbi:MAG: hypothetical protein JWL66_3024, partial [Sphingomonadales bacterium]|nr:hypothetical protein [Sphingomonadales bacterium]